MKKPSRHGTFGPEAQTKPCAANPFTRASGRVPTSRRDPAELLVSECPTPRSSRERPALRPLARVDEADLADPATPRPVDGGIALEGIPRLAAPAAKLVGMPLDHKAGFVIACIDGESTVQTLIDVSGLAPIDVVGTLERLVALGIVRLV